jgi:hypothetical protein
MYYEICSGLMKGLNDPSESKKHNQHNNGRKGEKEGRSAKIKLQHLNKLESVKANRRTEERQAH